MAGPADLCGLYAADIGRSKSYSPVPRRQRDGSCLSLGLCTIVNIQDIVLAVLAPRVENAAKCISVTAASLYCGYCFRQVFAEILPTPCSYLPCRTDMLAAKQVCT